MDRRSVKPGRGRGREQRPPARRMPPPPDTGKEAEFLGQALERGRVLVVQLASGSELRGKLVAFDRDQITLERPGDPIVIRKNEIRYLRGD